MEISASSKYDFQTQGECDAANYWGLKLLDNGAVELWSKCGFPLGSVLRLQLDLAGVATAEIQGLVVDCVQDGSMFLLTLVLLDGHGVPVCPSHGCCSDLELSS